MATKVTIPPLGALPKFFDTEQAPRLIIASLFKGLVKMLNQHSTSIAQAGKEAVVESPGGIATPEAITPDTPISEGMDTAKLAESVKPDVMIQGLKDWLQTQEEKDKEKIEAQETQMFEKQEAEEAGNLAEYEQLIEDGIPAILTEIGAQILAGDELEARKQKLIDDRNELNASEERILQLHKDLADGKEGAGEALKLEVEKKKELQKDVEEGEKDLGTHAPEEGEGAPGFFARITEAIPQGVKDITGEIGDTIMSPFVALGDVGTQLNENLLKPLIMVGKHMVKFGFMLAKAVIGLSFMAISFVASALMFIIMNPIALLAVAIAALLTTLYIYRDEISAFFTQTIPAAWKNFTDSLGGLVQDISDWFNDLWAGLWNLLADSALGKWLKMERMETSDERDARLEKEKGADEKIKANLHETIIKNIEVAKEEGGGTKTPIVVNTTNVANTNKATSVNQVMPGTDNPDLSIA